MATLYPDSPGSTLGPVSKNTHWLLHVAEGQGSWELVGAGAHQSHLVALGDGNFTQTSGGEARTRSRR